MGSFKLLAHPWWVNLLLLVPLAAYFLFRREKPELTSRELLTSAMFALSFGFVEGAVAIGWPFIRTSRPARQHRATFR
jgi:hypothetical protein